MSRSLINRTASVMHHQHGFFVSDSLTDAPVGAWGTKDNDLFEPLGRLKDVGHGVPDPVTHDILRTPRWFLDEGVGVGQWKVGAGVPGGLVSLSVTLDFSSNYGIACFLADHSEVQLDNLDAIGDALAELYREKGDDWKLNRKWVYTGLRVRSGFIVMNQSGKSQVTLTGKGVVNASGVPVKLELGGLQGGASASAEIVGLDGITPFVKLAEVFDPVFKKASWRQIG